MSLFSRYATPETKTYPVAENASQSGGSTLEGGGNGNTTKPHTTSETGGQPVFKRTASSAFIPDANGKVDIRSIVEEIASDSELPENDATPAPADSQPAASAAETEGEGVKPADNKKEVKISPNEFITGELVVETLDFFIVLLLCWVAQEKDGQQFSVDSQAEYKKRKLIKVWDLYLKSIDYKIPIGWALVLVNLAVYAPAGLEAWNMRKEKAEQKKNPQQQQQPQGPTMQQAAAAHQTPPPPPKPPDPVKVKLPPLQKVVMPAATGKNGKGGRPSAEEAKYRELIKLQQKQLENLQKTIRETPGVVVED